MLINLTNHPYKHWSKEQKQAATEQFGEVVDIKFPDIPADADEDYVIKLAVEYGTQIEDMIDILQPKGEMQPFYEDAVHLMGEMTFCYALIDYLGTEMNSFYASTTERNVHYDKAGNKVVDFKFVKFRQYRSYWEGEEYDDEYDDEFDDENDDEYDDENDDEENKF